MIIIEDSTGITVKETVEDIDHVRLVPGTVFFMDDEGSGRSKPLKRPPAEYSVNELRDMLEMNKRIVNAVELGRT